MIRKRSGPRGPRGKRPSGCMGARSPKDAIEWAEAQTSSGSSTRKGSQGRACEMLEGNEAVNRYRSQARSAELQARVVGR